MTLNRRTVILAVAVTLLVAAGIAVAAGIGARPQPGSGSDMDKAGAAALAFTGGGRIIESEASDEHDGYEIEVMLNNGQKVEVQVDAKFKVTGQEADDDNDEHESEDGPEIH